MIYKNFNENFEKLQKRKHDTFTRDEIKDEQDLKYDLKKGIDRMFARDQLSVIKIYFKESQITLCTNGKGMGDRSRAHRGEGGDFDE